MYILKDILQQISVPPAKEKPTQEKVFVAVVSHFPRAQREYVLDTGTVDIWIPEENAAVEIKTQGSQCSIVRQCGRYVQSDEVAVVYLATTSHRIVHIPPFDVDGVNIIPVLVKTSL